MQTYKWTLVALCSLPITIYCSFVTHEIGHAVTAYMFGMDNLLIYLWPGFEVFFTWDNNNFMPNVALNFGDSPYFQVGATGYTPSDIPNFTNLNKSIIAIMGSGFNYLISIVALLCVYKFKPTGFLFILGVCLSLFFYDLLLYSVLPTIFNLSHLFFLGSEISEPIEALVEFGIHQNYSIGLVIALSTIQIVYLYRLKYI